ncbi:MAG: hypothetical protein WCB05_15820 [Candidatus Sulfotelmatobacter sp.]
MNLEAFCYLGLIRFPEQLEASLSLFPDDAKAEASQILSTLKPLSKAELVQRWARLRDEEYVAMRRDLFSRLGFQLDVLSPSLQPWCISWWANQHG